MQQRLAKALCHSSRLDPGRPCGKLLLAAPMLSAPPLLLPLWRLLFDPLLVPPLLLILLLLVVAHRAAAGAASGCQVACSTAATPRVALSRPCTATTDSSSGPACRSPLLPIRVPLPLLQQNAAQGAELATLLLHLLLNADESCCL
jgi:hypothetical protein